MKIFDEIDRYVGRFDNGLKLIILFLDSLILLKII